MSLGRVAERGGRLRVRRDQLVIVGGVRQLLSQTSAFVSLGLLDYVCVWSLSISCHCRQISRYLARRQHRVPVLDADLSRFSRRSTYECSHWTEKIKLAIYVAKVNSIINASSDFTTCKTSDNTVLLIIGNNDTAVVF